MSTGERTAPTLVGVALVVLGLAAGFLVGTTATGQAYATVGTVHGGGQAYAVNLEDDRLRLQATATDAPGPASVQVAVYDPEDVFFGFFEIEGDGAWVDIVADKPGAWVLFISQTEGATLDVQVATEEGTTDLEESLIPLPVRTYSQTVAEQRTEDELDTRLALRLDQRPAMARLVYQAQSEDLRAVAESEQGPVYELATERSNVTEQGMLVQDEAHQAHPENLATGRYQVNAKAASFQGVLRFVYQVYERGEIAPHGLGVDVDNATRDELLDTGAVVAELKAMVPVEISPQRAGTLLFVGDPHTTARVLIYDGTDSVVGTVQLGEEDQARWDWEQDENASAASATFPVHKPDAYVLVADHIGGASDRLHVVLPGVEEAQPGREIAIQETTVTLGEGPTSTATEASAQVDVPGGLVGVSTRSMSPADTERHVRVTGPHGVVFQERVTASSFGLDVDRSSQLTPENLTTGDHEVTWSSNVPTGSVSVTLSSYHR